MLALHLFLVSCVLVVVSRPLVDVLCVFCHFFTSLCGCLEAPLVVLHLFGCFHASSWLFHVFWLMFCVSLLFRYVSLWVMFETPMVVSCLFVVVLHLLVVFFVSFPFLLLFCVS